MASISPERITASRPPAPAGMPVVGVLPQVRKDPLNFFLNAAIDYGPVVRLQMGPKSFYMVSSPEGVKYVLQENHRNFRKGYDQARPLMGDGLVTAEGDFWLRQRRIIQPMFNRNHIDFFTTFMTQATEEMLDRWQEPARRGDVLSLADELMKLTQVIIMRAMFSTEVGGKAMELGAAFDETLEALNRQLFMPFQFLNQLPTPANRRHKRALAFLDEFIYGLISSKRRSGEDKGDLLSLLVFAKDEETGKGIPDKQIRDELMTIFLAGHETTANALAWTWTLLGQNPWAEEKMVQEIDEKLQGRPPVAADIKDFTYMPMVLNEALRMYPPAWMFARHAVETDEVDGYTIPGGEMLFISPYVTHRHPAYWEEPDVFDPMRFMPERSEARHKYAYFPFGGGPRLCIGNNFALIESQLILARVLQEYHLEPLPGVIIRATPIATLQPRPGVPIRLVSR